MVPKSSSYIGQLLNSRYRVLEVIDSESVGQVLQVHDTREDQLRALKLVNAQKNKVPAEALIRFKSEAEILRNLHHPSIVKYFDFFNQDDLYGIVLEYLPWSNLSDYLKKTGPFSLENALSLVKKITEALVFIHDKKLLHLDLKPSNILISNDKPNKIDIKILDFGFSQFIGTSEIRTGGTLSYMAPEQTGILQKTVDHRADLYSLGIILYEILVGQVPFKDKDPAVLVYQHIAQMPQKPSQIRSDIPVIFEKIVLKLLNKDPDDRYKTTGGLLNDLEKYDRISKDPSFSNIDFKLGENDHWDSFPHTNPFIGREYEKEAVKAVVEKLTTKPLKVNHQFPLHALHGDDPMNSKNMEGKGSLILLEGNKGTGKTAFLKEIYNDLQSQPGITWYHQAIREEFETPYRTVKTLLGNLELYLKRLKHTQQYAVRKFLQKKFKDNIDIVKELVPNLSSLLSGIASTPKPMRSVTPEDYFQFISKFLERVVRFENRLIVIIDNFQYVEKSSAQMLFKLIQHLGNLPILFIFAYRYEELTPEQKDQITHQMEQANCHQLILSPLSETEVARLTQQLFSDKLFELPKLLDSLYYSTQGNPSQLRNLLQNLIDRQLIYFEHQAWHAKPEEVLAFIKDLRSLNASLSPLSNWREEEINALARGSIFLRSFSFSALKSLCMVPPQIPVSEESLLNILQKAAQANVLSVSSRNLYSFLDNNTRYALLHDLTPELKISLYRHVANFLEQHVLPHSKETVCDIARHWERAGDLTKALEYYLKSAKLTDNGMFSDRQAEVYYQKALICLNKLGDKAPDDPELQFDTRYNAIKHTASFSWEYDVLWQQLKEAEPFVQNNKIRRLKLLELQMSLSFVRGKKQDMLHYGNILMSMDIEPENEKYVSGAIIQLGSVVSNKGFNERIELLEKGLSIAMRNRQYHLSIGSSAVYAILSGYMLRFNEAEEKLKGYLELLNQPGLEDFRDLFKYWSGLYLELEKGNFKQSFEIGKKLEPFQQMAGPIGGGLYLATMGYIYGMLGHYGDSLRLFDKLLPRIEMAEQRVESLPILFGRIQVALRMDDPESAIMYGETALETLKLRQDPYMEAMIHILMATAYMDQSLTEDATFCLESARTIAIELKAPLLMFHLDFAQNRLSWLKSADAIYIENAGKLLEDMLVKGVTGFYEIYSDQLERWKSRPSLSSSSSSRYLSNNTSLLKLFEISYKITTTHELDELFDAVLEGAMQISGANHAYLFTCDDMEACPHDDLTHPRVTRDADGKRIPDKHYQFSTTLLNLAKAERDIIITRDARSENRWEKSISIQENQLRSILVAPIIFENILKGFIYLDNSHAKAVFTINDRETIGVFATQVAIALNNAESFARQQKISAENERLYEEIKEYNQTLEQQVTARTQELKEKTLQLQELNINLEKKVSQELDRRLEQEQLLIQHSKMAAMGEMIGMIAHQWRQPLSSISTVAGNMQIYLDLDRIEKSEFSNMLTTINDQVQYLSNTINDFRDFFSPKKKAESVNLSDILSKTLQLIGKSLENKNIKLINNCHFDNPIITYSNEIMQVFLNIIKNAQDVLLERKTEKPEITIKGEENDHFQRILIIDNAGGVPSQYLEKIFEPYFSTKDEKSGTGLGLYMSKMIVEKHCSGELNVENVKAGACFKITLPLKNQLTNAYQTDGSNDEFTDPAEIRSP